MSAEPVVVETEPAALEPASEAPWRSPFDDTWDVRGPQQVEAYLRKHPVVHAALVGAAEMIRRAAGRDISLAVEYDDYERFLVVTLIAEGTTEERLSLLDSVTLRWQLRLPAECDELLLVDLD